MACHPSPTFIRMCGVCMLVSVSVCMHVGMCTCVCIHVVVRLASSVFINCFPPLLFARGLSLDLQLIGWLTSELRERSGLCTLSAGVAGTHHNFLCC